MKHYEVSLIVETAYATNERPVRGVTWCVSIYANSARACKDEIILVNSGVARCSSPFAHGREVSWGDKQLGLMCSCHEGLAGADGGK